MANDNQGRRFRRPKFSTVIALVALFAVLGGSAYAAKTVINGKNIKKNTVTSKAIKNATLKTKDLSSKAQADLQGQQGPQGPAGANGVIAPLSGESTGNSLLIQDNEVTVLTLNGLAANTDYVVDAKVQAGNGTALRVDCKLTRGGTELDTALWSPSGDFSGTTLALQDVSTGAGTSIVMTCEAGGGGGTASNGRITAIPVG